MLKRLTTLLAALMLLTFVAAGCGDDSESDSSSSGDTVATDAATAKRSDGSADKTAPSTTDRTETERNESDDSSKDDSNGDSSAKNGNGGASAPLVGDEAAESCKQSISASEQLSANAKAKLSDLCEKATSGDEDDRREAAVEACETLVGEAKVKEDRETALKNCKKAATAGR